MHAPIISGLYSHTRGGVTRRPVDTLREIPHSLFVNPRHQTHLFLTGDRDSARDLARLGCSVHRVFDDAPVEIRRDAVHKMKHWMCTWALEEYGEFLWLDWDTVLLRELDDKFWFWCRFRATPKFVYIPNYWATVNCGVYYACAEWLDVLKRSFSNPVAEPNDELLWTSVLPPDVRSRPEFWWGRRVVHVETRNDFSLVTKHAYFAHVKRLDWANDLRRQSRASRGNRES